MRYAVSNDWVSQAEEIRRRRISNSSWANRWGLPRTSTRSHRFRTFRPADEA